MLHSARGLRGYRVEARDERLGWIEDLCFDDRAWEVRYIVTSTGRWPGSPMTAVPVRAVALRDHERRALHIALTREAALRLRDAPPCVPGSRRRQIEISRFRFWFASAALSPTGVQVAEAAALPDPREKLVLKDQNVAPHLRSFDSFIGYEVRDAGGRLGRLYDLQIDTRRWAIDRLVVCPRRWRRSDALFIPPERVERLDRPAGRVQVSRPSSMQQSAGFGA